AVRRLDVAVNVHRLIEVEIAVRAPAERVDDVVGVLGAEAGEQVSFLVGFLAGLGGGEVAAFGAIGDVAAAVAGADRRGDEQAVREDGGLVRLAVVVGVFEDDDLVVGFFAGFDLRVDFTGGDPEAALGVEVHLDR